MKGRSRAAVLAAAVLLAGCAEGVKIIQEHDNGGIVVYPFKEGQGPMLSSFRKEALAQMKEKCHGRSYTIIREGEAKGRARVNSPVEGAQEIVQERRWGIEFQCK